MKKSNTFFEMFASEYVEIVQDFEVTHNIHMTEEGVPTEMRIPMTVQGFVMDSDGEFLYLSPDGEEINQALPIHTIKHIQIVDVTKNELDSILDTVDTPDKSGFN